jgi:hypothetical protein
MAGTGLEVVNGSDKVVTVLPDGSNIAVYIENYSSGSESSCVSDDSEH